MLVKEHKTTLAAGLIGVAIGFGLSVLARRWSKSVPVVDVKKQNVYETKALVDWYLMMHFGSEQVLCPYEYGPKKALNFPRRCATLCVDLVKRDFPELGPKARVIDVGCAVGGATFVLAEYFESAVGMDFSHAFVNTANTLKQDGKLAYTFVVEGDITESAEAEIHPDTDRRRCVFKQGSACDLTVEEYGRFHVVLAANLLCRLPDPRAFLRCCQHLIVPGGFLVMPSPYSWETQYTPKEAWIGGTVDPVSGAHRRSADALKDILKPHFTLEQSFNEPFFIKETARKHQWSVSHVTIWKRRGAKVENQSASS